MRSKTKARYSADEVQRERDNRKIAYQAALESIVLLENKGMLPINPEKSHCLGLAQA